MAHWNMDSFKTGICEQPPLLQPYSLLSVSNNCCIRSTLKYVSQMNYSSCIVISFVNMFCILFPFRKMHTNFSQLFNMKAHLHHFRKFMQDDTPFSEASETIQDLIQEYEDRK